MSQVDPPLARFHKKLPAVARTQLQSSFEYLIFFRAAAAALVAFVLCSFPVPQQETKNKRVLEERGTVEGGSP